MGTSSLRSSFTVMVALPEGTSLLLATSRAMTNIRVITRNITTLAMITIELIAISCIPFYYLVFYELSKLPLKV